MTSRPTEPRQSRRRTGAPVPTRPALPDLVRFDPEERSALRRRTASRELVRLRRGVYLEPVDPRLSPGRRRQEELLAHMRAVAARLTTDYWFSHTSAALAWGCWTWHLAPLVHVTQLTRPAAGTPGDLLERHVVPLPTADRLRVGGLPVTSLGRTVLDCARTLAGPSAIVVADSALALGLDPDELDERLDEAAGSRGVRRARRVVAAADGASESPLESLVRWHLVTAGLPRPEHAVEVATWNGTCWIDLGWPELKVGIEVDGALKYDGALRDGRAALVREKRRHDALVEAGWVLLRVTIDDLKDVRRLVARVERALWHARSR